MPYKYFRVLNGKLEQLGLTPRKYLAEASGIPEGTINSLFSKQLKWNIDQMYRIMDLIHEPDEKLGYYFPREERKTNKRR